MVKHLRCKRIKSTNFIAKAKQGRNKGRGSLYWLHNYKNILFLTRVVLNIFIKHKHIFPFYYDIIKIAQVIETFIDERQGSVDIAYSIPWLHDIDLVFPKNIPV